MKKKTKKKTARKNSKVVLPLDKARLHNKIRAVSSVPHVQQVLASEPYGDDPNKPDYYSVPSAEVFYIVGEALLRYGLTVVPVRGQTQAIPGFSHLVVLAEIYYQITDVETGYSEEVYGSALGDNQAWAANSAQTLARKQALQSTFNISYPQPEGEREMQMREIKAQAAMIFADKNPEQVKQDLDKFFAGDRNGSGNTKSTSADPNSRPKRTGRGKSSTDNKSRRSRKG